MRHFIYVFTINGPRTCLLGFRQSEFQTDLLSYRDWLENWNFTCSKVKYGTFKKANNEGDDQTARMRRLVCACAIRNPSEDMVSLVEAKIL